MSLGCTEGTADVMLLVEGFCDSDDGAMDGGSTRLGSLEFDSGDLDGCVVVKSDGALDGESTRLGSSEFDSGDLDGCVVGTSVSSPSIIGELEFDSGDLDGRVVGTSVSLPSIIGALLGFEATTVDVGSTVVVVVGACVGIPVPGRGMPKLEHSVGTSGQKTNTGPGHPRSSISALAQTNEESAGNSEGQTGRVISSESS